MELKTAESPQMPACVRWCDLRRLCEAAALTSILAKLSHPPHLTAPSLSLTRMAKQPLWHIAATLQPEGQKPAFFSREPSRWIEKEWSQSKQSRNNYNKIYS